MSNLKLSQFTQKRLASETRRNSLAGAVVESFGQVPRDVAEQDRLQVWLTAQGSQHLDRDFRAVCDCRYGHVAVHLLNGAFNDQWTGRRRVHRRCAVSGCQSLWSEWA